MLVKRSDKKAFYNVDGTFQRMKFFTELSTNKNAQEYSRQYVDEDEERTDVVGYAPASSFAFDDSTDNDVLADIANIIDNELTGTDAQREIVSVDFTKPIATGFKAYKRTFAVIADSEGGDMDAYTYSGTFNSVADSIEGVAVITAGTTSQNVETIEFMSKEEIKTYEDIQHAVQLGLAPVFYQIGDTIPTKLNGQDIDFFIIGFDEDLPSNSSFELSAGSHATVREIDYMAFFEDYIRIPHKPCGDFTFSYYDNAWHDEDGNADILAFVDFRNNPANGDKLTIIIPHNMTLRLADTSTVTGIKFDAEECTFSAPDGLLAHAYNFKYQGSFYTFTLTQDLPSGGALRYDYANNKMYAYDTLEPAHVQETVDVFQTESGQYLGTLGQSFVVSGELGRINGYNQTVYGNQSYNESAILQWANATQASNWWIPQNEFDRIANNDKTPFYYQLDPDFKEVLGYAIKKTRISPMYDNEEYLYETSEPIFLLSVSEVFGGTSIAEEGQPYSYYVQNSATGEASTNADSARIARSGNTAKAYWLRTISLANTKYAQVSMVNTDGSINGANAYGKAAALVACIIC